MGGCLVCDLPTKTTNTDVYLGKCDSMESQQTDKTKRPDKRGKPDAKFEPSKFQRLKNRYNVWSQTGDISQEAQ